MKRKRTSEESIANGVAPPAANSSRIVLPNHDVQRIVIDSIHAEFSYEVLIGGPPEGIEVKGRVPLIVVLDGFIGGLTAIESARLMMFAQEIEPIYIAAVSPIGGFTAGGARRLRDFSADTDRDISDDPLVQVLAPLLEAAGVSLAEAFGGSDAFRRFLSDELIPEVAETKSIDENRLGIYGHSGGAAFLFEALLEGDTPFTDYVIGDGGPILTFGTLDALVENASAKKSLPAKRVFFGSAGDTRMSAPIILAGADELLAILRDPLGLSVETRHYADETHTTMAPGFIKDGLLHMYGTGNKYSDMFNQVQPQD